MVRHRIAENALHLTFADGGYDRQRYAEHVARLRARDAKPLWDHFDLTWSSFTEENAAWLQEHGAEYELTDDGREPRD